MNKNEELDLLIWNVNQEYKDFLDNKDLDNLTNLIIAVDNLHYELNHHYEDLELEV